MARAIEIVEWHKAFAESHAREAEQGGKSFVADAWRSKHGAYDQILVALREEAT
jgi:hypothetical protein